MQYLSGDKNDLISILGCQAAINHPCLGLSFELACFKAFEFSEAGCGAVHMASITWDHDIQQLHRSNLIWNVFRYDCLENDQSHLEDSTR